MRKVHRRSDRFCFSRKAELRPSKRQAAGDQRGLWMIQAVVDDQRPRKQHRLVNGQGHDQSSAKSTCFLRPARQCVTIAPRSWERQVKRMPFALTWQGFPPIGQGRSIT